LIQFIGMWHTHPGGLPVPSPTDISGVEQLVEATQTKRGQTLMLIVGASTPSYTVASYVFTTKDFERFHGTGLTRSCSIQVKNKLSGSRNVGLALSGGGSRAIAFHLGCLRALQDRGILDRLQVVSAVSGGSVIAGMYAFSKGSFQEFDKSVVALLRRGLQRDIAWKLANPMTGAGAAGTVAVAGSAAIATDLTRVSMNFTSSLLGLRSKGIVDLGKRMQPPFRRWMSSTVAFEEVLSDTVLGKIPITSQRRGAFHVVFNACELRSGSAFRFGSRESGCWRYGAVYRNAIDVSYAVAASAAYPALLPALDEYVDFIDRKGKKTNRRVLLTDGGVYDNLGASCLDPKSAGGFGYNSFTPEYIICCDAGQGIFQDYPVPYLWGSRMVRAFESVFRKAQNGTQNRLHRFAENEQIRGFVLSYLGQIDDRVPYAPSNLIAREQVFDYPTDFGAMSINDINLLAKRGEQLTRALISHYCPEL
jgi:NTE family protein